MPAPKHTTRQRYFTAQDAHGVARPADRLLYLDLVEVDEDAGVARFAFETTVADVDGEVWRGTVAGWEGRVDVAALSAAATAQYLPEGILEIPLSAQPQLTQIEVLNLATGGISVYWIQTRGSDARTFRYRSFPADALAPSASYGYLKAVGVDDYEPIAGIAGATHAHALLDGEVVVVPLAQADASVRMRHTEPNVYLIYGF